MIKLREAVAYAKSKGKRVRVGELSQKLWTGSIIHTSATNYNNLANGDAKSIKIDFIPIICKELGVSADFLFGISPFPNREEEDKYNAQMGE